LNGYTPQRKRITVETKTIAEQFPWAEAGADAYVYEQGSWGYRSLTPAKIKSVTKARINLEGGRSFYVPKYATELKEVGRDRYRSPSLIPVDDPAVEETRVALAKQKVKNEANAAVAAYSRSNSVENAQAAVAALTAFIEASKEEAN
jgi:hypothetical protein